MMRHSIGSVKVICIVLTIVLLSALFILGVSGNNSDDVRNVVQRVYDRAGFLSEKDILELENKLAQYSRDCDICVATHIMNNEYDKYTGDNFLHDTEFASDSLVLLVITRKQGTYYYDLYTYGIAYSEIKDTEVDRILDNSDVYDNIKSGKLKDGIFAFADLANTAAVGRLKINFTKIVIFSSIISGLISAGTCFYIYGKYKLKLKPANYPLNRYTNLELTEKSDDFAGRFVTRTKIQTSSGGNSSSRTGGGSGHRGGR